jgi:type IV pilus assembly protein PilO
MAAMDDFNRLPRQQKVMLFVVAGLLLGALYWQFRLKPLKQHLEDAEAEHQQKIATNKKLEGDIPKFEALKAQMTRLKLIIDENQKALPTEAELPAFFDLFNRKVTESGVEVSSDRRLPEQSVDNFVKVPVEIEMTGTFMQIKKFFASLVPKKKHRGEETASTENVEDKDRPVSIEGLQLGDPIVKNHEIVLTAKFTMITYRQVEAAAPPNSPASATLQKPIEPAQKPLPPANTPAGAKARVEQSLDKGDQRNRNATGVDEAKTPAGSAGRLKGGL